MAYSPASANAFIKLILLGTPIAGLADNASVSPSTDLYISLLTAAPGAGSTQSTNELVYPGYARMPVPRSPAGWSVIGNEGFLVNALEFLEVAGTATGTATHLGIGTAAAGNGLLLLHGALTPVIPIQAGVVPRLKTSTKVAFLTV